MASQSNRGSFIMGLVLIVIGFLLLFDGPSLFDIIRWIFHFWPVGLIALGLYLVMGHRRPGGSGYETPSDIAAAAPPVEGSLYRDSLVGDLRVKLPVQGFNGGVVKTLVGSVVIDASQTVLEPGEHRLYLRSGMGDVHLDLMPGMAVKVQAHVGLGDIKVFDQKAAGFNQEMAYQTPRYDEASARLLVITRVGLGDIKVF
ncbi:MAG TPA: cell wall-active antibiotics response protein LiaF [bacterium]|nr:cell wall-active antibiotics response protein LiaF [bacterium]HOY45612.1 cell wall-active antibiotics response protein LiaF [bacterium]HPG83448.1 cell wall-active antibiotics response protein LiaF [bacterium]HPM58084.1 cell wall-active antibiotics response protein LiaF [bacterium]